jgi:hypothetical protein
MMNAYKQDLPFAIHEGGPVEWERIVDASLPSPMDFSEEDGEPGLRSLTARHIIRKEKGRLNG